MLVGPVVEAVSAALRLLLLPNQPAGLPERLARADRQTASDLLRFIGLAGTSRVVLMWGIPGAHPAEM